MKKIMTAVACAALFAGGAYAQNMGRYDRGAFWQGAGENPSQRIKFLQDRIDRGIADRSLDGGEAARANRELNGVRDWLRSMHWRDEGRLTPEQRAQVNERLDRISSQIRWMRGTAAPAAPTVGRYDSGNFWRGAGENPSERIRFLQERINRGLADHSLDQREGARANNELNGVRDWLRSMHWRDEGRLTPAQRADVNARLERISSQIRWMRNN